MINENSAHHLRGYSKEMRAVLPMHIPLVDQAKKGLINKR
jgi:hypothetical protein